MTDGPFTVVWEGCDQDDWNTPGAVWKRHERTYQDERTAVHAWLCAKQYENTRPVSITPEPDWSGYIYAGRTPVTK